MESYHKRKLISFEQGHYVSPFSSLVNMPPQGTSVTASLKKIQNVWQNRFNLHPHNSCTNLPYKLPNVPTSPRNLNKGAVISRQLSAFKLPSTSTPNKSRCLRTEPYEEVSRSNKPRESREMVSSTQASQSSFHEEISSKKNVQQYKLIRLIGRGKFGSVFLAVHIKSNFVGALKVIEKKDMLGLNPQVQQKMKQQLINEIKIQSYLNHPNLIQLYDFFYDQERIYLFMELGTDGHLFETLASRGKLSEETTSIVTRQIVQGIQHLHNKNIIHRDIKLQNIVFTCGMAKICDFGWSVYAPKNFRSTICGTPLYLSPQILKGKKYNDKIDIWAIGTLSHEMATGKNPFGIRKQQQLGKIIKQGFQMKTGTPDLKNFIAFVLCKQPEKRPSADKLLSHNFIYKYREIETAQELFGSLVSPPK